MDGWVIGTLAAILGAAIGASVTLLWRWRSGAPPEADTDNQLTGVARGLAHEIRNPLNTISITLQLLEEDITSESPLDRAEVRAEVQRLRHEVQRLEGILTDFQRYARLLSASPEGVDLPQLLEELLDFLEPEAGRAQVDLHRELGAAPTLRADPALLRQAFLNLIINGFQAMPEGGTLTVSISTTPDAVGVSVADTGPGIDATTRERIFDPFYSTKKDGTGLGLSVVDKVATLHGGKMSVESTPGRGATFTVSLPRRSAGEMET